MNSRTILAIAASALLTAAAALAAPTTVAVQGRLANAGGSGAVDGTYAVTWRLYDSPAATVALWTGVDPGVTATDGIFSAVMGDEPSGTELDSGLFAQPLWLGVTIDAELELPRSRLHVVPRAAWALGAGDLACW